MKTWQKIKQWLYGGCACFTVIVGILLCMNLTSEGLKTLHSFSVLFAFPCGLILSAANRLLGAESISGWGRRLLHFALYEASICLYVILLPNTVTTPRLVFLLLVLIAALYWAALGIVALFRRKVRRLMEED